LFRRFFSKSSRKMDAIPAAGLTPADSLTWPDHEKKIETLLPDEYHTCNEPVSPSSMGSAGLKYDEKGQVAWAEIWTSFCGLAMGGGPPHRGTWLGPTGPLKSPEDAERCLEVGEEIRRAIRLISGMRTLNGPKPGWITVITASEAMALWLARAIVAENVVAHGGGPQLHLPCGPDYRIAKEVKNVVVALSKGFHYWSGHLTGRQKNRAGALLSGAEGAAAILEINPFAPEWDPTAMAQWKRSLSAQMSEGLQLTLADSRDTHWVGLVCKDEAMAGWFVRSAIAENLPARREGRVFYLPIGSHLLDGAQGQRLTHILQSLRRFWDHYGIS